MARAKLIPLRPSASEHAGEPDTLTELLTLSEVAALLQVSLKTVRRLVANRRLPHFRVGRVLRFDPADVSRWLTARKVR